MGRFHRQAKIVFQALACSGTEGGSGDGVVGAEGRGVREGVGVGGGGQWGGWWWYEGCSRVNSESKRDALSASVHASRLQLHARNYRSRRVAGEMITVIGLWLVSMIVFVKTYDWFVRDCFREDLWLVYTWLFSWRLMIRLYGVIVFVKTYDWFMQDCFCEDLRLVYTWLFSWKHIDRQQWGIVLEHQTHEV